MPKYFSKNKGIENETLTAEEAAAFLKIHVTTLSKKTSHGQIPGIKVGKRWVFIKDDLIVFIRSKYQSQSMTQLSIKDLSCHSIKEKIPKIGGSKLRLQMDNAYNKVLGLTKK